jgi:hypothetical protein
MRPGKAQGTGPQREGRRRPKPRPSRTSDPPPSYEQEPTVTRLTVPTHYPAHQAATTAAFAAPNPDRTLVGTDGRQPAQLTLPGT